MYTRYNFCIIPWWDSDIMLYENGRFTQLDPEYSFAPQTPAINNAGVIVWDNNFHSDGRHGLQLWENGVVTDLTDWGAGPDIGASGEIVFRRWYQEEYTEQLWMYRDGRYTPLTFDSGYYFDPCINDAGDIVFNKGWPFGTDVHLFKHREGLSGNGPGKHVRRR